MHLGLGYGIGVIAILLVVVLNENGVQSKTYIKKTKNGYTCPEDPITEKYPDPADPYCIRYFLCHRTHAFPQKCPGRSVFHPVIKDCLARDRVPEKVCPNEVQCGVNGYYKDVKDCTRYYLCFYQSPTRYSCTRDHVFDDEKKECVEDKEQAFICKKPKALPQLMQSPTTKKSNRVRSR